MGCHINHPSQRQHGCLYGAPLFYHETCFAYTCEMHTKTFLKTLMSVLDTILDIRTEPEKILGNVEATHTNLLPESNIEQRLAEICKTLMILIFKLFYPVLCFVHVLILIDDPVTQRAAHLPQLSTGVRGVFPGWL